MKKEELVCCTMETSFVYIDLKQAGPPTMVPAYLSYSNKYVYIKLNMAKNKVRILFKICKS